MRDSRSIVAPAFAAVAIVFAAPASAASDLPAQLDALIAPHFPPNQPGAAVLVKKGEQILLRKAYGLADVELAVPMKPDGIFRLGSVTKQFTAAAIMLLVDEGKLSLRDDVRKYVPAYPAHGATVTLEHLLTHTGGVPAYTEQAALHKRSREDLTHEEILSTFKDLPLDFAPGDKWSYSNSGYYLLGMVIEKVTGKSYADFVGERIFKPLGMTHTSYGDVDRIIPGRVAGYDRAEDRITNAEPISMKVPFAAGALVSSVDDLALWDRAISDGKLLKKESWARVFLAQKLKDGSSTGYGFGWSIGKWQGHRLVSHSGGIPGFNTAIVRLPEDRVVVVVLCNSMPAPINPSELATKLAALTIGKPLVDPKVAKVDATLLDGYVGVYKIDDKLRAVLRRDGNYLTFQPSGGPLLALEAESDTKFFVKGTPIRLVFARDAAGRISGFDLTQPDGNLVHLARTDEHLPAARAIVTVDPKILEGYVGHYELAPGFILTVTREGAQLYVQATGQPRFAIFPTAPTEFFLKLVDAQLTFHAEKSGPADSVVLHQGGRDLPGKRIH
jgi:CubicO group peptidase (beta-lactamase class C family)